MNTEELRQLGEEKITSEDIFDGEVLHVKKDIVRLPNGNSAGRELIRHIGAVCVVPVTEDGCVIMERQFRYPINMVITEIPAGKLDSSDEDRLEAIKRELREETGYEAQDWVDMGLYYPAPAYSDEKITMYLARKLTKGSRSLDEDEFLNIVKIPIKDLVDDIMSGVITDGKTQVAILKAAKLIEYGV
ncbi:MAG: NUDIX hydrolase [Lachnospiraceae bacterium]|nr:NUDIX hydrolase [Lachnospiraceae bacterium]